MNSPIKIAGQLPPQARSDDIKDLFRRFDGDSGKYQEIGRDSRAVTAEARWPILPRLKIEQVTSAPAVARFKPAFRSMVAQAPLATPPAPIHTLPLQRAMPFQRAAPMAAAAANPADALSAIFQRLVGKAAEAAPAPRRSMLFNRNKIE